MADPTHTTWWVLAAKKEFVLPLAVMKESLPTFFALLQDMYLALTSNTQDPNLVESGRSWNPYRDP